VILEPFSLPLADPIETARGRIAERRGFLVRHGAVVETGIGEATPLDGWTESHDECESALLRAADAPDADAALEAVDDAPAARHGVSLAVLGAAAATAERSLYRYLGSDGPVERVPANATVGDADADETAERVRAAAAAGFDCVKVKAGARSLDADLARVGAARDAAPDVALRVDANAAWDRETAARAFDALADLDVADVEQPLDAADLDGHASLRGGEVGVAVDESVVSRGLDAVLDADAADVVVLKPMALGGPDRAYEAGERARRAGVAPVVTTTFDAVYARTAAVHVAAALSPIPPCGLATADALATDLAPDPAPVTDGAVVVPQGKGNGVPAPTER